MKVIAGVDGSKYARWAIEWIAQFPFASSPQVTALHVMDIVSLRAPFLGQPVVIGNAHFIRAEITRLVTRGKKIVAETTTLLSSLHVKGRVVTERGTIATSILRRATDQNRLVVIGSRGLDALDRFMLGSVSTKVTLHAPCSVLVVKQAPRLLKRVILAIDGSKSSEKTLQFLLRNMRSTQRNPSVWEKGTEEAITVMVVHVMPSSKCSEMKESGKALVHSYAEKLVMAGYEVEEILRFGNPADEIIKLAQRRNADLVLTGAKGLGAIGRLLLGSVSMRLIQHSRCSVLLVR
ncbi:MAG TPA: universal stress protein [Nitrospiraceae bacterium]|nr:universal stress protein [Nitrospiraceae bacterium]